MDAAYILIVLALVLVVAAALRIAKSGTSAPQARTWLLVAAIFGAVSAWLLSR